MTIPTRNKQIDIAQKALQYLTKEAKIVQRGTGFALERMTSSDRDSHCVIVCIPLEMNIQISEHPRLSPNLVAGIIPQTVR